MDEKKKDNLLYAVMGVMMVLWLLIITVYLINGGGDRVSVGDIQLNMISGTEYEPGEWGKVIVELRNKQYQAIGANCTLTILYPNESIFIYTLMNTTAIGTYSVDFEVSNVTGIYEYSTSCLVGSKSYVVGKSFHVSGTGLRAWVTQ